MFAAHVNRGNALLKLARLDEALVSYGEALKLDPEQVDANFNAALAKLCLADFRDGWEQYEYRWKKKEFRAQKPNYPQPMWRGETDIAGKTVLLVDEQGLGDTIKFVRYAPLVADLGARVIVGVQPPLKAIVATVPGIAQMIADGEMLPEFDLLLSDAESAAGVRHRACDHSGQNSVHPALTRSDWRSGAIALPDDDRAARRHLLGRQHRAFERPQSFDRASAPCEGAVGSRHRLCQHPKRRRRSAGGRAAGARRSPTRSGVRRLLPTPPR